jgi:Domain of unknown function (DUF1905)
MKFEYQFTGKVIEWRGPAPFYFVPVNATINEEIRELAKTLTYGWGVVPAKVNVGGIDFTTSLIPRNGVFLVPLKVVVWRPLGLAVGDTVTVNLVLG